MSTSKNQKVSRNFGTEIFSLNLIFDRKAGFLLYLLPLHGLEFYIFSHTKCTVHCGPDFRHHGKLLEVAWVVGDSKKWGCSPFTIRWYDFVDHHLNPEFCWQARWNFSKSSGVKQTYYSGLIVLEYLFLISLSYFQVDWCKESNFSKNVLSISMYLKSNPK